MSISEISVPSRLPAMTSMTSPSRSSSRFISLLSSIESSLSSLKSWELINSSFESFRLKRCSSLFLWEGLRVDIFFTDILAIAYSSELHSSPAQNVVRTTIEWSLDTGTLLSHYQHLVPHLHPECYIHRKAPEKILKPQ